MNAAAGIAAVEPRALGATRTALHHAALLVSAVGRSLAPRQPGFRHAALFWERGDEAFAGWPVEAPSGPVRARLEFHQPAIRLDPGPALPLADSTADTTMAWLRNRLASNDVAADDLQPRLPKDLEPGPLTDGRRFAPDPAHAAALAAWFALADEHLAEAATGHDVALPLPCWPDHFDLAAVVKLPPPAPTDAQITLGFSPGDGTIDEPYFYVLAWPLAPTRVGEIPAPAGGRWQVEGWQGLALPAAAVLEAADATATVRAFLERGFEVGRDLVLAR